MIYVSEELRFILYTLVPVFWTPIYSFSTYNFSPRQHHSLACPLSGWQSEVNHASSMWTVSRNLYVEYTRRISIWSASNSRFLLNFGFFRYSDYNFVAGYSFVT